MAGKYRGNGEGTIFELPDGGWRGMATVAGKRRSVRGKTRREVQQKLRDMVVSAEKGILPPLEKPTLRQWMERWLVDVVSRHRTANTYRCYEQIARIHVLPALGHLKLTDLQPAHLRKLYSDLDAGGLSPAMVQRVHATVRRALKLALDDNLVARNVATAAAPPAPKRKEMKVLTPEQARTLLVAARGSRIEALLALAVATGMRQGELLGLQWKDVNFEAGTLHVQRQLTRYKMFSAPKTAQGRRTIHLPAFAAVSLREHRARQIEERLRAGSGWVDLDLVFPTSTGRPLGARDVLKMFKAALRRAGLPDVRFHDIRHSAATMMLLQGENIKVVQSRLGHATAQITLDVYAHALPSMDRDAASRLDALLA